MIAKSDVRRALKQIKASPVSPKRRSTKYCLVLSGKHYPSKHVVRLAYEMKHNRSAEGVFQGGKQIINILESLGYSIGPCESLPTCQDWCISD